MLSRVNGVVWMEGREDAESAPWRNQHSTSDREGEMGGSFSAFKSMLDVVEGDEFNTTTTTTTTTVNHHFDMSDIAAFSPNLISTGHHAAAAENLSSASCSPSSSVFNNLDTSQLQFFMPPKPTLSSLLGVVPGPNPLFDLGCEGGFLDTQSVGHASNLMNRGCGVLTNFTDLSSSADLGAAQEWISAPPPTHLLPLEQKKSGLEFGGLFRGGFGEGQQQQQEEEEGFLLNRSSKLLRPLETFPSVGEQPTLFQKRAALRKNVAAAGKREAAAGEEQQQQQQQDEMRKKMATMMMMMKKNKSGEDVSFGGSGLNYDSDELMESFYNNNNNGNRMVVEEEEEEEEENESGRNGGGGNNSSNANSTVTADGDHKGKKKKGLPAKNLMAERRRRKKLNDRLYMLRSVVPKISKMDRASILGDAIEYLKELLQRINDLHNELESAPAGSSLTPTASFHPLTPTLPSLPCRIKEELCPSSMPSPNGQPARVEVRAREGRAVNIHMFCSRKPGLLLSTMRVLDNLGLDIQQAVISCFNGFALDIFRAEQQCKEGQDVHPEQIKAVLLESASFHGVV